MTEWALAVDETGSFGNPKEPVAVAGLLYQEGRKAVSEVRVRGALASILPYAPWPYHFTDLNHVSMHVLCMAASQAEPACMTRPLQALRRLTPRARGAWDGRDDKDADRAIERLRKGQVPHQGLTRRLDRSLQSDDPELYEELQRVVTQQMRARVAWELLRPMGLGAVRDGAPRATVLAAFETLDGDAWDRGAPSNRRDALRYEALLFELLQRTADLLARWPEQHRVSLDVLTRPGPHGVPFDAAYVQQQADSVLLPDNVTLVARSAPTYDRRVSAMLVLADFVANQGGKMGHKSLRKRKLDYVHRQVHRRLRLFGQSGSPVTLTHLAGSGSAADLVFDARTPGQPPGRSAEIAAWSAPRGRRRWVEEQAKDWATHLLEPGPAVVASPPAAVSPPSAQPAVLASPSSPSTSTASQPES